MNLQSQILQFSRNAYSKIFHPPVIDWRKKNGFDFSGQAASDIIKSKLCGDKAIMIARIGSGEMSLISLYLYQQKNSEKYIQYIKGNISTCWWDADLFDYTFQLAGLFPTTKKTMNKFCRLMLEDLPCIDILGSWLKHEDDVKSHLQNAIKIPLADIEPYYHNNPWSEILEGKKVLVIHPFADTIKKQYTKRLNLFKDNRVLPNFDLITIKAVQSLANNETGFTDWFEALNFMKEKISEVKFDFAIIGCGAYGLPLAAHVKRLNRKAIHMGGATQAMFGVTGKRWEQNEVSKFINEHWVRPSANEAVTRAKFYENACYW